MGFTDENVVEPEVSSRRKDAGGHTRNEVQRTTTEDGASSSGCVSQDSTHRYCLGLCLFLVMLLQVAASHLPGERVCPVAICERHESSPSSSRPTKSSRLKKHKLASRKSNLKWRCGMSTASHNDFAWPSTGRDSLLAPSISPALRNQPSNELDTLESLSGISHISHRLELNIDGDTKGIYSVRKVLGFS